MTMKEKRKNGSLLRLREAVRNEGRLTLLALLVLTLGGAALRLAFLFQPVVHDEAVTYVYFASRPLSTALSYYPFPNNHLLNTLLVKASTGLFGNSPAAMRLPAFIAGVLLIPAAYLAIRSLYGRQAALIGSALVAVSSTLVYYSVSARGYTMQALAFALAIRLGARVIRRGRTIDWVGIGVLLAAGFYAVPTMLFFAAGLFVWLSLEGLLRETEHRRKFFYSLCLTIAGTALAVALLYLPVVLRNGIGAFNRGNTASLGFVEFLKALPGGLGSLGVDWRGGVTWAGFGILFIGLVISVVFQRRVGRQKASLPLVFAATGLVLIIAQRVMPYARNWLPALPIFFGAGAAGLVFAVSRVPALRGKEAREGTEPFGWAVVVVVSLLLAIGIGTGVAVTRSAYQPAGQLTLQDADRLAAYLKKDLKPGDVVYLETNVRKPLEYYCMKRGVPLDVFYGYADYKPSPSQVNRAIVIDVRKKAYPLSSTLRYGHLSPSDASRLVLLQNAGASSIYELNHPGNP